MNGLKRNHAPPKKKAACTDNADGPEQNHKNEKTHITARNTKTTAVAKQSAFQDALLAKVAKQSPELRRAFVDNGWADDSRTKSTSVGPNRISRIRAGEIRKLCAARFGHGDLDGWKFPETLGVTTVMIALINELGMLRSSRRDLVVAELARHAPWLLMSDIEAMVFSHRIERMRPNDLGNAIGLTAGERQKLGIKSIAAAGSTLAQRRRLRRIKNRDLQRKKRALAKLQKPNAPNLSQLQPWKARGISRRTYYRHLERASKMAQNEVAQLPSPIRMTLGTVTKFVPRRVSAFLTELKITISQAAGGALCRARPDATPESIRRKA
ncbi:MAG: hypothetical protein CTY39_02660 [Hyphomicrobium sp.]|nr:MAG: hypothetical protein CTY39_02660 [Hyphomicrobium sp.]